MIKKIQQGLGLFQTGKRVANPAAWKRNTIRADLVAFMTALVGAYAVFTGADLDVGNEQMGQIADALVAIVPAVGLLWSAISHIITTNKIGANGVQIHTEADD